MPHGEVWPWAHSRDPTGGQPEAQVSLFSPLYPSNWTETTALPHTSWETSENDSEQEMVACLKTDTLL